MIYSEREQFEVAEETAPKLRVLAKRNGATNGAAKNGRAVSARMKRTELAALGWEARRLRLGVK